MIAASSALGSGQSEILGRNLSSAKGVDPPAAGEGLPAKVAPLTSLAHARALTEKEAAENPPEGPYFVVPPATHVTTRAGQAAALTCIVKQLGDRQVRAEGCLLASCFYFSVLFCMFFCFFLIFLFDIPVLLSLYEVLLLYVYFITALKFCC